MQCSVRCGADMADIFVSYAKEDLAAVDLLTEDLEAKGFSVWYDTQLLPGHEWRTRLREEIDQSRALIVVWTLHSKSSTFVQEEVDRARSADKPVIALRERGFKVEEVPLGFGGIETHIISDRNAVLKALNDFKIIPAAQIAKLLGSRSVYEIFARAIPDTTLVDRSNSPEGHNIRSALSKRGFCARLCGPTKSGKSVLLHQILGARNPIYLSGGLIRNLQLFFGYLAVKVEGGQMLGDDEATIMERVLASKRPIVIDDFHRVNFPTRRAIVNRIQAFLDAEVNVVLVSWTDIEGEKIDSDPGWMVGASRSRCPIGRLPRSLPLGGAALPMGSMSKSIRSFCWRSRTSPSRILFSCSSTAARSPNFTEFWNGNQARSRCQ